jgi:hypothetical protein
MIECAGAATVRFAQEADGAFVCRARLDIEWRQDSWVQELASAFLSVNSGALLPVIPE